MSYYHKKIVYLSYMERGVKVSGAGFIKLEEYDTSVCVEVMVKGIGRAIHKKTDVLVLNEKGDAHSIGSIEIKNGEGRFKGTTDRSSAGAASIQLKLSDGNFIEGILSGQKTTGKETPSAEPVKTAQQAKPAQPVKTVQPANTTESALKTAEWKAVWRPKETPSVGIQEEKPSFKTETEHEEPKIPVDMNQMIQTDKWKQLKQLYPVIHPYEDDREYISIEPKDFVVMSGNYQHLANNSFLLHGFYNYRHIILGKEKGEAEQTDGTKEDIELVYIGVPGVYYERENMVALMFGFEQFECAGGIAQQGKFGYYLRKVQI